MASDPAQRALMDVSVARRGVELELKGGGLEGLAGDPRPTALGPVRDDLAGPAGPIGDAAVERLDHEAAGRAAGHQRVEASPESVDLDDIPGLYALESHFAKGRDRGALDGRGGHGLRRGPVVSPDAPFVRRTCDNPISPIRRSR